MYDIVIVGAGSAGIPCAIRAAQRGLRVLVLEKDSVVGGTLHITAGHLSAGGTQRQQQMGIQDSAAQHWQDVERISHGTADKIIAQKAVELAPGTVDWLQALGYRFHEKAPLIIYGHEAYSQPRTYFGADDYAGGPITQPGQAVLKTLLPVFEQLVAEGKITLLINHSLKKILTSGTQVTGIVAQHNGKEQVFTAKQYVLATGGYASNPAFFEQQHPGLRLISTARHTSTGDGIQVAMAQGAVFHHADKHISTLGGIELEPGSGRADFWQAWARVSNSHDRKPREIYVNQWGQRFMNEYDATVDERERKVLAQPGQQFYVLFDEAALQDGPCIVVQWDAERLKAEAERRQCCWAAPSIEALAEAIQIPADALQTTVTEYNQAVAEQHDGLGRTLLTHPLLHPPFYALRVHAYCLISFGGLQVNEQLQVIHQSGYPFANLYAAGEILGAGTTSGHAFCGGMLLTPAISFGKWLGEMLG
jgi:fumarate reductase flavoprotein subunit